MGENLIAVELRGGTHIYTVYSLEVLQEVARDPDQAWCLGSCGSLDAHAVGAARTGTMMRTSSALLNTRRRYISPKGFTPVWRQSDDPG